MDNVFAKMFSPFVRQREAGNFTQQGEWKSTDTGEQKPQPVASANYSDHTVYVGGQQTALTVSPYYRALELRARTFSMLVPEIQKKDFETGGNFVIDERGVYGRLNDLLQVRPNPFMSKSVLLANIELNRIQKGNAVVYLERDVFENIAALWLCSTAFLDTVTNEYIISYNAIGGTVAKRVPASDVLHLRNIFSRDNGLTGIPTLVYMRDVLSLDATNRKLQTENAAKGGRLRLLLTQGDATQSVGLLGKFSKDQMSDAKAQLQAAMSDDVIVQPCGTSATPIQMTSTEMDILSTRKFTVEEISRFTGVPRFLLGDSSNTTYKTADAALQELYTFTTQPLMQEFEEEATFKMINPREWKTRRMHLCERELQRLDPMGQAQLNEKLIGLGVKTINEVRKDYDQPAIEGGDRPFITVQAQPIDRLDQQQPTELKPGNYTVKQPKQEPATEPEEGKED